MNVISTVAQLAPISFVSNQVALWGGRAIVLVSSVSPAVAICAAVAFGALIAVAYLYQKLAQANAQLAMQNQSKAFNAVDVDPVYQELANEKKFRQIAENNFKEIEEKYIILKTDLEKVQTSWKNCLQEIKDLKAKLQTAQQSANTFASAFESAQKSLQELTLQMTLQNTENAELKEDIKNVQVLLAQARQAKVRELEASGIDMSLSASLSASQILSSSWVEVSSGSISDALIKNGKEFLSHLLYADTEELESIISDVKKKGEGAQRYAEILWVLMDIAHAKNEEFEEGTFICKDENGNLGHFLTAFATPRISSHLKGVGEKQHYGMDVHPTQKYSLFHDKRHVLTIPIDQPSLGGKRVMVKPENFGTTTSSDLMWHAVEYVESLGRKMSPGVFGSDDAENYRKERVPQNLLKEYKAILDAVQSDSVPLEEAKKFGVSSMYRSIKEIIVRNHLSPELSAQVTDFRDKLAKMGNPEVRIGREVIVDNLAEICHAHFIEVASAS